MLAARETVRVCVAQMAPVWLNKARTLDKACAWAEMAASQHKADLVAFGEALVPGYPTWLADTKGASFDNRMQKEIFAHYLKNGVRIHGNILNFCSIFFQYKIHYTCLDGDLKGLQSVCKNHNMAVIVGVMEAAADRGGHSLYCSRVYIDRDGGVKSVHRKLMPTYDERLVWAQGDGHGLVTHALEAFTVSALNCWENWVSVGRR
jgi:nitrilase